MSTARKPSSKRQTADMTAALSGSNWGSPIESRLQDYLDDKLQTLADLETVDSLLANVRSQQELLRKQLEKSIADLDACDKERHIKTIASQRNAQIFEQQQESIESRIMIVTRSETSDDAARRFASSMDNLQRLGIANGYFRMLHEVDRIENEATQQLKTSPEAALTAYGQLRAMANSLSELQTTAEGAAPHLIDHIESRTFQLRATLKGHFEADLQAVLKTILWPKPKISIPIVLQDRWNYAVTKLLELQKPELEAQLNRGFTEKYEPAIVLLPFEIMAQALEARFRYHFDGNRPTNRLDKPEYFISHVLDLLSNHVDFVNDNFQTLLLRSFYGCCLISKSPYVDATSAFITSLLPMIRRKVSLVLEKVSLQPQLLSHFVHELTAFDSTLRDEWQYDGLEVNQPWKGITWEVLVLQKGFDRWLQVEKDFALSRYQSIIEAPDSGELDYDTVAANSTKPTRAAVRVNDLLETITDRYRGLSSFSQKLRFLIDVQISIFDRFHSRLHSSLEAFLTMTSSFGRTVHGLSATDAVSLEGVAGLDRLCRVYGSANYLERAMRDWSNDVFFLDLWTELQQRSNSPTLAARKSMNVEDTAAKTSITFAQHQHSLASTGATTGALFDETANAYNRLRIRSETVIVETLSYNIRESLRPYSRINPWATIQPLALASVNTSTTTAIEHTPELSFTLTLLADSLTFLAHALAPLTLRRIARELAQGIETYLWERVLLAHRFSSGGAEQFGADVDAFVRAFEASCGSQYGAAGLRSLLEARKLLGLSAGDKNTTSSIGKVSTDGFTDDHDKESMAWNLEDDDEGTYTQPRQHDGRRAKQTSMTLGLWDVETRLFADNESARLVLDELGVESLTESEARKVLMCRLELSI